MGVDNVHANINPPEIQTHFTPPASKAYATRAPPAPPNDNPRFPRHAGRWTVTEPALPPRLRFGPASVAGNAPLRTTLPQDGRTTDYS